MEYSSEHDESKPSAGNPLGVYYPGSNNYGLWNEPDQPNWVGHLITKYRPGPRYTPPEEPCIPGRWDDQSQDWIENPLLVNDYAMGGDTVHGVVRQVRRMYLPGLGKNTTKAPWTAEGALFGAYVHRILCSRLNLCNRKCISEVTWVGINDCAYVFQYTDYRCHRLSSLESGLQCPTSQLRLFLRFKMSYTKQEHEIFCLSMYPRLS